MNKLIKIIQFIGISIILYSGNSNAMQRVPGVYRGAGPFRGAQFPQQPLYPQIPQAEYQYGQQPQYGYQPQIFQQPQVPLIQLPKRIQPTAPIVTAEEVSAIEPKPVISISTLVFPTTLTAISNEIVILWHAYEKALTSTGELSVASQQQISQSIYILNQLVNESGNKELQDAFKELLAIVTGQSTKPGESPKDFYNKAEFGQILNNILDLIRFIAEVTPTGPYKISIAELQSIPYIIGLEEPSTLYTAGQVITGPLYGTYDWTKGAVGGIASGIYGYGQAGISGVSGGLRSLKEYVSPSEAKIEEAKNMLPKIKLGIRRLRSIQNRTPDQNTALNNAIKKQNEYESILRGWKPALGTAAAAAATGYLLYKKYGGGAQ